MIQVLTAYGFDTLKLMTRKPIMHPLLTRGGRGGRDTHFHASKNVFMRGGCSVDVVSLLLKIAPPKNFYRHSQIELEETT